MFRVMECLTIVVLLVVPSQASSQAIFGHSDKSETQLYYPLRQQSSQELRDQVVDVDFDLPECYRPAIVVMKNILYMIGGNIYQGDSMTTTSFNPSTHKTTELAHTNHNRSASYAAALPKEGSIIVCGTSQYEWEEFNTCERYNVHLNEWKFIQPIPVSKHEFHYENGAVTLLDSAYMMTKEKVFKLDTDDKWIEVSRMPKSLTLIGIAVAAMGDDSAMVCGSEYGSSPTPADCYIYSAGTDTWRLAPSLSQKYDYLSLVWCDERLWAIGGNKQLVWPPGPKYMPTGSNGVNHTVELYDEHTGWHRRPGNPEFYHTEYSFVAISV